MIVAVCVWVEEFQPGGFIICFSWKKGGDVGLILLAKDETPVNEWMRVDVAWRGNAYF